MVIILFIIIFALICACYSQAEKQQQEIINNFDQVQKNIEEVKELLRG